jgi:cytochrome c-type biogenesis protein CcmF
VLSLYAVIASATGAKMRKPAIVESSERAVIAVAFLIILATAILLHALLTNNFGIEYVAHYSSTTQPAAYRITALWGGQAGSLLFWVLILAVYAIIVLLQNQDRNRQLIPYVLTVLMSVTSFFLGLLLLVANPFQTISPAPLEGQGLNPLLQNYWMVIHPVMLYLGYVGMDGRFAFAVDVRGDEPEVGMDAQAGPSTGR